MSEEIAEDPTFFDRADSHIHLANEHRGAVGRGKASASFMYGSARFQAWNAACWVSSAEEMKRRRQEAIDYFVEQYTEMLSENLDDYIEHYTKYMEPNAKTD